MDALTAVAVRLQNVWFRARDEESGQGLVEYALIIVLISIVAIAIMTSLGASITSVFSNANSALTAP